MDSSEALTSGLLQLAEQIPGVCWTTDRDLRFTNSTGRGLAQLGLKLQQVVGMLVSDFLAGSESDPLAIDAHRRALLGENVTIEQEFQGRTFQSHIEPLHESGRIVGVIGVAIDLTERKAEERRLRERHGELEAAVQQRTLELSAANAALRQSEAHYRDTAEFNRRLLLELDHRVGNNLAGLISLVSLMRATTPSVEDFADAIDARLRGLAQVNHLLTECRWKGIDLHTLIESLISSLQPGPRPTPGVELVGPPLTLAPEQAMPLAMILVEWLTNSFKYGAFGHPRGKVRISWEITAVGEPREIILNWREMDGPLISGTPKSSLGTQLVCGFAQRELKGDVELTYPSTGADHTLQFPLR